jgi:uncharacterized membrane protein YjjB (DUF3815 family)
MSQDPSPDDFEGEYGAVRLPDSWHVLSLACFAGALGSRFLAPLLTRWWQVPFYRTLLPGVLTLGLAALGLVLGLIGLRSPQGRGTARIAVFLNGIVLALGLLAAVVFLRILRR